MTDRGWAGHVGSSACTTKRYYSLGSTVVAVRDSSTTQLTYLLGDQLGSTTVSINASGGTPVVQRYLPYGAPRSTTGGTAVTDRGWIGQTKDASTGLQYLNARYYDPAIGRFTATDPLVDMSQPVTLDRYGYAGDSPISRADPSGLFFVGMGGGSCASCRAPTYSTPPEDYAGATSVSKGVTFAKRPGRGVLELNAFIAGAEAGALPHDFATCGPGFQGCSNRFATRGTANDRGRQPFAHPTRNKFHLLLDFEKGTGGFRILPSCDTGGQCESARGISEDFGIVDDVVGWLPFSDDSNKVRFSENDDGTLTIKASLTNSVNTGEAFLTLPRRSGW